ncbi:MAG TPA: alpha/beta hydrolase [Novosphingobium sp.]
MKRSMLTALLVLALPGGAFAQGFSLTRIPPQLDPAAIDLPAAKGASRAGEIWNLLGPGNPAVRNVTQPTLTAVLPDPAKATGAAVVVAPGGGFMMLSMQTEGFAVARALADRGIAAFVLKYRVEPTAPDEKVFMGAFMERLRSAPKLGGEVAVVKHPEASADALAALRLVRSRAAEWQVDPARVGIIGFSAGAMTALELVQTAPSAEKPAFFGYVYGPQAIETAPADAPPMFDAIAFDDQLFQPVTFPVAAAWQRAGRKVELHAYQKGGHGFGLGAKGTTTTLLLDEFTAWLSMQGFLTPSQADRK